MGPELVPLHGTPGRGLGVPEACGGLVTYTLLAHKVPDLVLDGAQILALRHLLLVLGGVGHIGLAHVVPDVDPLSQSQSEKPSSSPSSNHSSNQGHLGCHPDVGPRSSRCLEIVLRSTGPTGLVLRSCLTPNKTFLRSIKGQ